MVDVYLLETLMRERTAAIQRGAALQAALRDLKGLRGGNGGSCVARLRRAVAGLLPTHRVERMASR